MLDEHAGLRNAMKGAEEAVRQLVECGRRGRAERRALRKVLRQLASLEVRLGDHFVAEEAGGNLAEALQAAPCYDPLARRSAKSPDDWEEVHRSFAQLAALLYAHEHAEGELVRCSLLDGLETVDQRATRLRTRRTS